MLTETENKQRLELYLAGYTDDQAASAIGISTTGYSTWRNKHGLEKRRIWGVQGFRWERVNDGMRA